MSNQKATSLQYLFDRPSQPVFQEKGLNGDVAFDVPSDFLVERYQSFASTLSTSTSSLTGGPSSRGTKIKVDNLTKKPDISIAESLDRRANFSLFNDNHLRYASNLIEVFMSMKNVDELMSAAVYAQQRTNPQLFIYALSVAMLHRSDTSAIQIPSHTLSFPELYVNTSTLNQARKTCNLPTESRQPINVSKFPTASIADPESRIAYFREDIAVNLHHWHWHLVYPNSAPENVVRKDRRGELFYYMHQQVLARYNFERFSNNLPRAKPITNFLDLIPEGYYPKLDSLTAAKVFAPRQANSQLTDISRQPDIEVTLEDMIRWRDRIFEAIQRGSVTKGTGFEKLTETEGIDVLGNIIEASTISVNRNFYGNYHNQGHMLIAYIHDPDNRYQETNGVMGDSATAMRDPAFYRWHTTINNMFDTYKQTLPPYTEEQLNFSGVKITKLMVKSEKTRKNNNLITHWETDEVELSRGLDFAPRGSVKARFSHLQHRPYTYTINVQNNSGRERTGTVRIFLAPQKDERRYNMQFRELRSFFIEMDRFTTTLKVGSNEIKRDSKQSSVTIPFEVSFRDLEQTPSKEEAASKSNFVFCGCGWPHHMLVPRGMAGTGMPCVLFAMITDFDNDKVDNLSMDANQVACDNAFSFCGVRNSRYPDRKPMGFPFDRLARAGVATLKQFLTPNMMTQDVTITFQNQNSDGVTLRRTRN